MTTKTESKADDRPDLAVAEAFGQLHDAREAQAAACAVSNFAEAAAKTAMLSSRDSVASATAYLAWATADFAKSANRLAFQSGAAAIQAGAAPKAPAAQSCRDEARAKKEICWSLLEAAEAVSKLDPYGFMGDGGLDAAALSAAVKSIRADHGVADLEID